MTKPDSKMIHHIKAYLRDTYGDRQQAPEIWKRFDAAKDDALKLTKLEDELVELFFDEIESLP